MSIRIPDGCKPSKAVSKDQTRPILCVAYLRQRADGLWLEATDSYIAVALRVKGEATEGWVPVEVLTLIERNAKHLTIEQIDEATWTVTDKRGLSNVVSTYTVPKLVLDGRWPDFEGLGVYTDLKPVSDRVEPFGFDPALLALVGAALGGKLRVDFKGPLKPLQLTPLGGADDRRALLMPVRLMEVAPNTRKQKVAA